MANQPVVAVLMGSKSDLPVVEGAFKVFDEFGIPYEAHAMSAHRTPVEAMEFAANAEKNGFKVVICAAGMAAHLGGVVAAHTTLPVIGIPIASEPFNGLDALFSIVQMPPGIPVAAVTAGKAGGKNAALYAVSILALGDAALAEKLKEFRRKQTAQVLKADAELQEELNRR
ncbi:5-(carboxyamino)imidazole ribonucleotide mutase [Victivallaceae bacterium BBE-744-WT-12]|jgi:5-(carboxyamino)imidazole ribonucleotide mutase|uniref:N5-carboxyaminoimidazole ribonucleotide mutase n=1 Tax=Victivallis lenta TaxID=2606640 RepID=A0A844G6X9_9BACT|nr:5-(carboxyamino)imidazole ribonucleotide mutase [Victivallis lenta]AVM47018.1 5-(carboxyamino)imidazole ribonucleotide mutase [Victivallales bacterium CCUG 44730]MBS1453485.1 5-(carboxyamino)imidazole ribonucleotide mutase [Lentisphaeria bacterium]MBS5531055.1 5-(carboxyamino)imidazole ribonucleotide mutase [bacterium]MST98642.1 5-(carboxyamino)imidazole ribonucleotide mutase [Victivallis lenta]HBP06074.1 5-(carboxyamino)imidazole ribonucleotide mutase [Lentisphaeria bacterium]